MSSMHPLLRSIQQELVEIEEEQERNLLRIRKLKALVSRAHKPLTPPIRWYDIVE